MAKPTLTFDEWFEEVNKIAAQYDFHPPKGGFTVFELEHWKGMWESGLSPEKAWDKA